MSLSGCCLTSVISIFSVFPYDHAAVSLGNRAYKPMLLICCIRRSA